MKSPLIQTVVSWLQASLTNSPAAKAGIQVGDVILRLNKQDNLSIREMMQIISDTKPNTEVIVTISRLGKVIDLPVIIEEFPSN